jgi:hypothetical protein
VVAWPAMEKAMEPGARAPGATAFTLMTLIGGVTVAAMFAGDGSGFGGVLPVGGAAVALLAGSLAVFAVGRLALPQLGRSGVGLVATVVLFAAWTGATIAWSIAPDRTWDVFNKCLAFAAWLGLGIVLAGAAGRFSSRLGAALLAAVTGVVLSWALLAKAIPALVPQEDPIARLHVPVDYWNVLALLADAALALALWLGTGRGHRLLVRVAGGLLAYVATVTLLLTLSRVGVLAGFAVIALWLALSRERLAGGLLLVAAMVPAGLVLGWTFTRPALVNDGALRANRVADGKIFGALVLAGAILVGAAVAIGSRRRLGDRARSAAGRGLLATAALVIVGGAVAFVLAVGNPVTWASDQLSGTPCSQVVNNPSRLGSLNPNARFCWWKEAWRIFLANDPEGAGGGTFEIARKRYRANAGSVAEPHSVLLQELSDGGIPALALFLALVGVSAWVCACAVRRLEGRERDAAVSLVAVPAAYGLHALVDYDWDFLAATAPTMVALGVLAGAGRPSESRRVRPLLAASSALLALAVLFSFASPRLSDWNVQASTSALGSGDFRTARSRALRARFFDPLAVDPVLALARIAERQRRPRAALQRYVQAVELQPENPDTWYELGLYEFQVLGDMCAGYGSLNRAYTLDPAGTEWVKGGPLDIARNAVNAGACKGAAS